MARATTMTERFTAAPFQIPNGGGPASCKPPVADTQRRQLDASRRLFTGTDSSRGGV
jgi:hypothetical protein